ncbi:MmcB family DNA repair protein [Larkinella terrae]|uniref:MmcB family DNA repair protein n=1 Tax=Larkinella terrae TaxID=2025311 RepID=A0A7K0EDU7_9BACT|nr:MmcB family DNA repair protein [Larkinella terrae]MRS59882.1 MmcB family DNA repair protein [Larkinella terrae]
MTHKQLVEKAYKWVLQNASCGVAFKEMYCAGNGEYCDVIGFGSGGHTVVIECKASRSDFLADKKKLFRQFPEMGKGRYRIYCAPKGLLKLEELPEKWGLLEVDDRMRAKLLWRPDPKYPLEYTMIHGSYHAFESDRRAEMSVMYSALRRLNEKGLLSEIIK